MSQRISIRTIRKVLFVIVVLWFLFLFQSLFEYHRNNNQDDDSLMLWQQQQEQKSKTKARTTYRQPQRRGRQRQEQLPENPYQQGRSFYNNNNTATTIMRRHDILDYNDTHFETVLSGDDINNTTSMTFSFTFPKSTSRKRASTISSFFNFGELLPKVQLSFPWKSSYDQQLPHLQSRDESTVDKYFNNTRNNVKLPLPIIVMGFPKAGTSSIFSFFQRQGFRSQHWYCCQPQKTAQKGGPGLMAGCLLYNLRHNLTGIIDNNNNNNSSHLFTGCGDFEVYSEINGPRKIKIHPKTGQKGYMQDDGSVDFNGPGKRIFFPQHFHIQEIHNAYPNATWILNWRDVHSWVDSVIRWGNKGDLLHEQFLNEYYMQGKIPYIPKENKKNNNTEIKQILKDIYYDHHDMVQNFVKYHPSHTLIEINITHNNTGNVLADAFGLDPLAWTIVNKYEKKTGLRSYWRAKRVYGSFDFTGTSLWWMLVFCTTIYLGWTLDIVWVA